MSFSLNQIQQTATRYGNLAVSTVQNALKNDTLIAKIQSIAPRALFSLGFFLCPKGLPFVLGLLIGTVEAIDKTNIADRIGRSIREIKIGNQQNTPITSLFGDTSVVQGLAFAALFSSFTQSVASVYFAREASRSIVIAMLS